MGDSMSRIQQTKASLSVAELDNQYQRAPCCQQLQRPPCCSADKAALMLSKQISKDSLKTWLLTSRPRSFSRPGWCLCWSCLCLCCLCLCWPACVSSHLPPPSPVARLHLITLGPCNKHRMEWCWLKCHIKSTHCRTRQLIDRDIAQR